MSTRSVSPNVTVPATGGEYSVGSSQRCRSPNSIWYPTNGRSSFTLRQWLVVRSKSLIAYSFVYFSALMRAVAFLVSFRQPNDEARLSLDYGLPMWALPSIAVVVLIAMTVVGSRKLGVGWKQNLALYAIASAVAAAMVLGDQALRGV